MILRVFDHIGANSPQRGSIFNRYRLGAFGLEKRWSRMPSFLQLFWLAVHRYA